MEVANLILTKMTQMNLLQVKRSKDGDYFSELLDLIELFIK